MNDVMPGSNGLRILVIFKKKSKLRFEPRGGELIFESGRGQSSCVLRDSWVRWNTQHSKNSLSLSLSLSLLVSKT